MYDSGVRVTALASIALLAACASAPRDDHSLRMAKQAYEAGNFELALSYTELAMQRAPDEPRGDETALHIDVLRAAGREEEARAFEDFVRRFDAGEDTDSEEAHPTRTECFEMERVRPRSMKLVRKMGDAQARRLIAFGNFTATYQIDASGRPINIRVVRARHPATAWLAIDAISELEVWNTRVAKLDPAMFPVDYCTYLVEEVPVTPRTL